MHVSFFELVSTSGTKHLQKLGLSEGAKIAEILGGVAVVMSVIYLAVQISDNNRLLRSQAHFNALELTQDPLKMMVENDGLASMIFQCNQAPNDVSPEIWQYNGWGYMYYQNIDGYVRSGGRLHLGKEAIDISRRVYCRLGFIRF